MVALIAEIKVFKNGDINIRLLDGINDISVIIVAMFIRILGLVNHWQVGNYL